jgi:CBS domain containing-hemolysin-like protein
LQKVLVALLIIATVLLSSQAFGLIGIIISIFIALEYGAISRIKFVKKLGNKLYKRVEDSLIDFIRKAPFLFKLLRSAPDSAKHGQSVDSRQELQYLVDKSENVLSVDERKLIVHGLAFSEKLVSEIMTPRSAIDSIKKSEFLGPLVLNDLHKIGHSRLPVINGDIDHIVGILNLDNLLSLDIKKSATAEKVMDPKVFYIRDDQTLQSALSAFLCTHHHLFIVVNESRETVGILSLKDVIESLLGRKIVDEFGSYDDLRAVASRKDA